MYQDQVAQAFEYINSLLMFEEQLFIAAVDGHLQVVAPQSAESHNSQTQSPTSAIPNGGGGGVFPPTGGRNRGDSASSLPPPPTVANGTFTDSMCGTNSFASSVFSCNGSMVNASLASQQHQQQSSIAVCREPFTGAQIARIPQTPPENFCQVSFDGNKNRRRELWGLGVHSQRMAFEGTPDANHVQAIMDIIDHNIKEQAQISYHDEVRHLAQMGQSLPPHREHEYAQKLAVAPTYFDLTHSLVKDLVGPIVPLDTFACGIQIVLRYLNKLIVAEHLQVLSPQPTPQGQQAIMNQHHQQQAMAATGGAQSHLNTPESMSFVTPVASNLRHPTPSTPCTVAGQPIIHRDPGSIEGTPTKAENPISNDNDDEPNPDLVDGAHPNAVMSAHTPAPSPQAPTRPTSLSPTAGAQQHVQNMIRFRLTPNATQMVRSANFNPTLMMMEAVGIAQCFHDSCMSHEENKGANTQQQASVQIAHRNHILQSLNFDISCVSPFPFLQFLRDTPLVHYHQYQSLENKAAKIIRDLLCRPLFANALPSTIAAVALYLALTKKGSHISPTEQHTLPRLQMTVSQAKFLEIVEETLFPSSSAMPGQQR